MIILKKLTLTTGLFCFIQQLAMFAIQLHPDNPHYFLWRGKPAILITSGEHYGSVLNLDFDYKKYLKTLHDSGLNLTRIFSGAYVEPPGSFNITSNTLAPAPGRFICPWARSSTPGYANGGNKFDLSKWDPEYFARLKDFVATASKYNVVVEMNLFCPFYEESQWRLSPMNYNNNINNLGNIARTNVYSLDKNGGLLAIQEAMTRKIVTELQNFDNVYFEVCNEPYFGGVTMPWQFHIIDLIVETEKQIGTQHLISMNIANDKALITNIHPAVSIFNFHYAFPPDTVQMNYHLNKVIGDNETGFKGTNNTHYRMEGWAFILAGGALYNNLDYSFTCGCEDGSFVYPKNQPGGGNPELRKQLNILSKFINKFDFVKMAPATNIIKGGIPPNGHFYVLAEPAKQYAIYLIFDTITTLECDIPPGTYEIEWIHPVSGKTEKLPPRKHPGGVMKLQTPPHENDLGLSIFASKLTN